MNSELIDRVKAFMREEPRRINMGIWVRDNVDWFAAANFPLTVNANALPPCGTICCVAGAVIVLTLPRSQWHMISGPIYAAQQLSGAAVKSDEASYWRRFFDTATWPLQRVQPLRLLKPQTPEYTEFVIQQMDEFIKDPQGFFEYHAP
jgi:hypothetical protein